eukprot:jgi/Hompol1/3276/HPOL_003196-RA
MFEVPAASVKAERASCPLCMSILSVASAEANGSEQSGSSSGTSMVYYFVCPMCRWDSQETGIRFDRPTGLAETTTLDQRHRLSDAAAVVRLSELKPQRVQLRTRRTKRCLDCEHILVKPEAKASSIRFSVKMLASDNLPRITIVPPLPGSPMAVNMAAQVYLRITNPLTEPMDLEIETEPQASAQCQVHLSAKSLQLAGYSDMDVQDVVTQDWSVAAMANSAEDMSGAQMSGPHEQLVLATITPTQANAPVQFPLRLSFSADKTSPISSDNRRSGSSSKHEMSFWIMIGVGVSGSLPESLRTSQTATPTSVPNKETDILSTAMAAMAVSLETDNQTSLDQSVATTTEVTAEMSTIASESDAITADTD